MAARPRGPCTKKFVGADKIQKSSTALIEKSPEKFREMPG